jgi:hypothetical protein
MSPQNDQANRYLIAIGTADYQHLPAAVQLLSVKDDLARMVKLFVDDLGYTQALTDLSLNPTHADLRRGLSRWLRDKERRPEDIVVIYYAGHGDVEGDRHYLYTHDSEQMFLLDSALPSEDLARMLIDSPVQQLLVILDTCYAGEGIGRFAGLFHQLSAPFKVDDNKAAGIYLIAAVGPKQEATGIFAQAFVEAVRHPAESYAGPTQPYLSLESVIGVVKSKLKEGGGERAELSSARTQEAPPFLHNPRFDPNYRDNRKLITIYQGAQYARPNYRNDIAALLDLYGEPFVGRVAELGQLADFAVSQAGGYLLLEAPAGYGKSALMANLILRHEKGGWPLPQAQLLYFFIREEGYKNTASAFYEALNAQLLSLLGLEGGVPNDQRELRKQFSQLWVEATQQAHEEYPLLLLLDGLDESATGSDSVVAELPTGLGDYVHIIVTSRPNPDPLAQVSPEHPFQRAQTLRLHTFGEAEIGALLKLKQLEQRLAQQVLRLTQGEPLFVRFVVQDIADKGTAVLDKLEEQAPDGIESYFRYQFRQLDQAAEGDLTWEILGLLINTRGGITVGEIAELRELVPRRIRKAIEPIQRYLIGQERIELMHLQLRKVLLSQFGESERNGYRQTILQWAQRYRVRGWPAETPVYLLRHYAAHLADAEDRAGLAALFANQQWLHVRVLAANYEYDGYLADLMLTWERTHRLVQKQPEDGQWALAFAECVRYALIRTSINSLAAEYEPSLVVRAVETGLWPPGRALSVASQVPDTAKRSSFMAAILATKPFQTLANQAIRRRAEKAGLAAALALQEEEYRARALAALAPQLSGELLQVGLAAALAIQDEWSRARALAALAPQLSGELLQAGLAAALALQDEGSRARALAAFVAFGHKNAAFLQQIRQALAETLLFRLQEQPRSAVLAFCANRTLFAPPIVPTEILADISESIIEICGAWEWL